MLIATFRNHRLSLAVGNLEHHFWYASTTWCMTVNRPFPSNAETKTTGIPVTCQMTKEIYYSDEFHKFDSSSSFMVLAFWVAILASQGSKNDQNIDQRLYEIQQVFNHMKVVKLKPNPKNHQRWCEFARKHNEWVIIKKKKINHICLVLFLCTKPLSYQW